MLLLPLTPAQTLSLVINCKHVYMKDDSRDSKQDIFASLLSPGPVQHTQPMCEQITREECSLKLQMSIPLHNGTGRCHF